MAPQTQPLQQQTHKAPEVQAWLAHPKRARWHLHFIPTSSSWLNLVERWFKELSDRRLRLGAFASVAQLIDAIETWVEHWNDDPKPFVWHKAADRKTVKSTWATSTPSSASTLERNCGAEPRSRSG